MSFRADVRERLLQAAEAELEYHGCYIALVSKAIVEEAALGWSSPVCLRLVPIDTQPGMIEIEAREVRRG